MPGGIIGGDPVLPSSEAEAELREVLRLEEIERRNRSLRSAPVAQSYRGMNDEQPSQAAAESPASPESDSGTQTAQTFEPPPATGRSFQQSLEMFREAVSDLEAAQTDPAQQSPPNHEGELIPPARSAAAAELAAPKKDYTNPTRLAEPDDPARLGANP